jgi:hypothetical protein
MKNYKIDLRIECTFKFDSSHTQKKEKKRKERNHVTAYTEAEFEV